jgi:uncharacterized membrane protein YsdA (DUF1294 family)
MLKSRVSKLIRNTFFIMCGAILCAFILIPVFSELFLDLSFTGPLAGFSGPKKLLVNSILIAAAFSASGFLTGLSISYFSRSKEVVLSLFSTVLVAMYYSVKIAFVLLGASNISAGLLRWRILELAVHMLSLIGFAALGAWLIRRKHRKVKLNSDDPALGNSV